MRHEPGFKPGFKRRVVHGEEHRPIVGEFGSAIRLKIFFDLGIRPRQDEPPTLAKWPSQAFYCAIVWPTAARPRATAAGTSRNGADSAS